MPELPTELTDRITFLMQLALSRAQEMGEQALTGLGLRGREYGVLALLQQGVQSSQRELGETLGMDRTTTMTVLAGLESRGLVTRSTVPNNRRANMIALTSAGEEIRTRAAALLVDCERRFLAGLAPSDIKDLQRMLSELSRS